MRIAILAPPHLAVPPVGYGGTEAVVDQLGRGLQDAGHDVLLVTTGDATCPVERTWCFEESTGVGTRGTIHELTHVWQSQTRGRFYLPLMRHPFCRYAYDLVPDRPFGRYGLEQQAEIVRHAFLARPGIRLTAVPEPSLLPFA